MKRTTHIAAICLALLLVAAACSDAGDASSGTDIGRPSRGAATATTSAPSHRSTSDDRLISAAATTAAPAATIASAQVDAPGQLSSDRDRRTSTTTSPAADRSTEAEVMVGEFERTSRDATSTFALDVDTASYTLTRRAISEGRFPDPLQVRVEEFVNAFEQDYPAPIGETFAIYADGAPHDLVDDDTFVLRVGIAARDIARRGRPDANLTLVVDVSGSMNERGKMDLVKDSLRVLVRELDVDDRVAIVAYDDRAWVALEPTFVDREDDILDAIDQLRPGGSTNVEAGLRLGYELARDTFDEGLVNRVILASDGVANQGKTDPDSILDEISEDAGRGIQMLAVGYGFGNYNDRTLERLADAGNGVYAYIDTIDEAERLFGEQLNTTLVTVALDAKVKVEFHEDAVRSWRLLGFENRDLTDRQFDDEGVDAGEIGAGHTVTALYEIDLVRGLRPGDEDLLGEVTLRWIDPGSLESQQISGRIRATALDSSLRRATPHLRWDIAVATTAELLRGSEWVSHVNTEDLLDELFDIARDLDTDEADQFADLVDRAVAMGL